MIDLNPNHLGTVKAILAEHVPECEVRAFGSRATWTAKDYSDLDLAILGQGPLDWTTLGRLKEAFEESDLPMRVDVLDWHAISGGFREVIEREHLVLVEREDPSITDNWQTVGEFSPLVYGKGLPERKRNPSGTVPVFGSNGVVGHHDTPLTSGPTVIVGRKGTVGAVHYAPVPCWPIDTTFFVTGDDAALLRYKYYALQSLGFEHMNADTAVPGLNRNEAHGRKIYVPPIPEQRSIAQILGTLDDKIELNRQLNETLEELARAIFKDWFVDFGPVRAKLEGRDT
ncbi:MAG: restriction endonuclease subunit S, partial [Truepera sp.]|nr:restriction endonuclease subunit S [Truepera sp.]